LCFGGSKQALTDAYTGARPGSEESSLVRQQGNPRSVLRDE